MDRTHKTADAMDEEISKIRDRFEDARERVTEQAEMAKEKGEELWEDALTFVRKHPGKAIGFSLLAGAVIGALLSRDRK